MAKKDDEEGGTPSARDSFQSFIRQHAHHALLTKDKEFDLVRRAQANEPGAMSALVRGNVRLLLSLAQKHRVKGEMRGILLEDLFNLGSIGLQRAILKFNPNMGCRLTTYSAWWIRQELGRAIDDLGRTIRIPVHTAEDRRKLARVTHVFYREFGREPDFDWLCSRSGMPAKQVRKAMDAPMEPFSLDAPVRAENEGNALQFLVDIIPDDKESPEDAMHRKEMRTQLATLIVSCLSRTEREIIEHRYFKGRTLPDTATAIAGPDSTPLSRERIRQIEQQAIKKLKIAVKKNATVSATSSS